MNLPNYITALRIFFLPVFIIIFYLPFHSARLVAGAIFTLACVTDWLDGYLARVLKQTSRLGAFLDPVADKLTVAIVLVLLVGDNDLHWIAIPAAIIVGREIVISALREWMAEIGRRTSMAVTFLGKFKTTIQMFSLGFLISFKPGYSGYGWLGILGYVLLYLAAMLTIWSMFIYLRVAWPDLIEKNSS
jgi:CDP-diacylglycerol--glycerol-3-phosphate 3-phosphatidyltransferase